MSTKIGMPDAEIAFRGLGATAIARGANGAVALILVDDTEWEKKYSKYKTIADFDSDEEKLFTEANCKYIKECLEGIPNVVYVFKLKSDGNISDLLKEVKKVIPRNCWIASTKLGEEQQTLVTWIKAENKNNKRRYKAFVYKATTTGDMHVVELKNQKLSFKLNTEEGEKLEERTGEKALPYLVGYLAGLPLSMSAIAKALSRISSVEEPEIQQQVQNIQEEEKVESNEVQKQDIDAIEDAINNGYFVLFNEEEEVKVARGVNTLTDLTNGVIEEMCFINTVEKMDLIYCDIFETWDKQYKGKYDNILDNQSLFMSASGAYFEELERSSILDPKFNNRIMIDVEAQRIALKLKYPNEDIDSWSDEKVMDTPVSTKAYFVVNIKITGIMEDIYMIIYI